MDEEKETKEEESKPTEDTGEGDKPATTPVIDNANEAAERLEAANKKQEELINKQEELDAKRRLGGGSEAGQQPVPEKKLTDIEYCEALQRGEVNPMKEDGFI